MSNDILDKGSSGRRIILLLTLLLLMISALIFLFNRDDFFSNHQKSAEPVVISPDGDIKTFPDDAKDGKLPAARVYDMLQNNPPATSSRSKKPKSVQDIVSNNAAPSIIRPANSSASKAARKSNSSTNKGNSKTKISVADLVKDDASNSKKSAKPATKKTANKNTASGGALPYGLQLASFTDRATAQQFLTAIKPQIQKVVTGKKLDFQISSGVLSNGQRVYRMRVLGFQTKAAAEKTCRKIKSQVTKPSRPDCLVLKLL